jgi:O-antigen ligase
VTDATLTPALRPRLATAVWALGAAFLLANLAVRADAFHSGCGRSPAATLALVGIGLAAAVGLTRRAAVGPLLQLFASSWFLFGFHSYRLSSQLLELGVTALALVLLVRLRRATGERPAPPAWPLALLLAYALLATLSLQLLPGKVLEQRTFIEGPAIGRAVLGAFPKDPLYLIASADRLWLFVLFVALLAGQSDARQLYRALFRGAASAAIVAVALGVLDFVGVLPLARYNLSHVFYGASYRRLQSTFGNPSWFACFVACALPFVLLEFRESAGWRRLALALFFPLAAAALLLSAARAAWLAAALVVSGLVAAALASGRRAEVLGKLDGAGVLALGSTLVALAALAFTAATTTATATAGGGKPGRLEGLSREMQYRGLGVSSPRRVAIAYALELAELKPLLGLGYESFNMHLRAQLELPGSGVSRVVNSALVADPSETVFDDSHDTYLQALIGTGALGLALWILAAGAALVAASRAFLREGSPEALAVLLGLAAFHFYGLFQGMAYLPVTLLPGVALAGYASALAHGDGSAARPRRLGRKLPILLGAVLAAAAIGYATDSGYASLKRRFAVAAYLPEEKEAFEGFYRPETGPGGEFRWMARRGIVNLEEARPFRLRFGVASSDVEREPLVLTLRFEGQAVEPIVFRRPGEVERRFSFSATGALRMSASRTFRLTGDPRELSVSVSAIRWE